MWHSQCTRIPERSPQTLLRVGQPHSLPRRQWLVVDSTGFVDDHHAIDNGLIATDALHIVERMKLTNNGNTLEIEYTFSDPKSFEGEFKSTKRFRRMEDTDITEASCLPDLNAHMPSTHSQVNVR